VDSLSVQLATDDGHPAQASRYVKPIRSLAKACGSLDLVQQVALRGHTALKRAGVAASELDVVTALAGAGLVTGRPKACLGSAIAYLAEVVGTGPAKASSGWGGYAGGETAWNAVHKADSARPGSYLPRRHHVDAYQVLSSGQVTSLVEHFDPPISAQFALAQITRDLLPGKVHLVYRLHTGQCQQEIYLGPQLGALLHNPGLGAFVELTSGGGVGHTKYDDLRVNRARITPLGAVGGQPCS
jgi:hypothetical protein